ncbi:MAG: hypothetical protein ACE5EY_15815, partial [Anaerolineae bacterium]
MHAQQEQPGCCRVYIVAIHRHRLVRKRVQRKQKPGDGRLPFPPPQPPHHPGQQNGIRPMLEHVQAMQQPIG